MLRIHTRIGVEQPYRPGSARQPRIRPLVHRRLPLGHLRKTNRE